ncbi:hypothetical protein [Ketogulonicigenium robustum]|uniref:hypothetical protein n=1 Tax=Ketogulonicigenium robustum TaxID=92947 RepID=UPI0012F4905C|nr:hypothetical protein [Ketogulonicigenium robustum]
MCFYDTAKIPTNLKSRERSADGRNILSQIQQLLHKVDEAMQQAKDLKKLERQRDAVAELLIHNSAYIELFIRLENEIEAGKAYISAKSKKDTLACARAIAARYKATA